MGDDQLLPYAHPLLLFKERTDRCSQEMDILEIDAALRLVEHDKIGVLENELENLAPLDLTAGEALVDITVEELVHVDRWQVPEYRRLLSSRSP